MLVRRVASHSICAFAMFYLLVCRLPLNYHRLCSVFSNKELFVSASCSFVLLCYNKQSEFGSRGGVDVGERGGGGARMSRGMGNYGWDILYDRRIHFQ